MDTPSDDLAQEVARFQAWAPGRERTSPEWECEYPDWHRLHYAVARTLRAPTMNADTTSLLLYALARDNEGETVLETIAEYPAHGLALARAAPITGESDARWQLATFLGTQSGTPFRELLRLYVDDTDEYVRRRALMAAARHDSDYAERVAWGRLHDSFEYARMAALSVLAEVGSPRLLAALDLLRDDPSEFVRAAVERVERNADTE